MFRHLRPVWAEINLDNLAHNIKEIKRVTKAKEIIGVVKADAYGHGALDIAPTLLDNGVTRLAVAVLNEAVELRRGGIQCPIMILGYTPPNLLDLLIKYDIEQTVYSYDLAKEISDKAIEGSKIAKIHIAFDSGMGRIGFLPREEDISEVERISALPNIKIEGIYSHFSTADEKDKNYTYEQLKKFNWFYNILQERGIEINIRHIANSAAIIDMPETHFEAVRPGVILYGYYPSEEVDKTKVYLKPVMSLKTNIVHLKKVPIGEYISYGRKFKTERESIIGTLPVGYADGYTRSLGEEAKVIINGKLVPVVGRICMDQCMVDLTNVPDVNLGDEVILMGEDSESKMTADELASILGTINYEVLCMISRRVPRVYVKDKKVIKIRSYV
ncbi:alanine racemase [Clostridium sp. BSD9I1]|uniref:alanine racemase n=1 Tax=Clostridium sp. BSD9I1 TaxID=2003589 RepID=UPI0016478B6B|nr:alanine racemase [Clostridium sp. BSD9I1]